MKTYLIVAEFKVREVAGLVVHNAEPLCLATGIEGAGGAREAMESCMRAIRGASALAPAAFVLYPLGPQGFGPPYLWFDPETLATLDPAGWLIATGRLERLGPVEVKKKGKRK